MFTGLVQAVGRIAARTEIAPGLRLRVEADALGAPIPGESIAVDGVCLTATAGGAGWFDADVSPETLACTHLGDRRPGDSVNLERSLRLGDSLGGHLVQGHVDGTGTIADLRPEGEGARLVVALPEALRAFVVVKGSIAVDGVSLTVAALSEGRFEAALIPETLIRTTLGRRRPGDRVNLEVDLIGRYIVAALQERLGAAPPVLTRELLERHGFTLKEVVP